jgi:hypothetical protein
MHVTREALGRVREPVDGFNADYGRDDRELEAMIGLAEEFLYGLGIEPAGDLLGGGDREVIPNDLGEASGLKLVLERLAFGFSTFERGVGTTDRVSERAVRQIVKAGYGKNRSSLCHGYLLGLG